MVRARRPRHPRHRKGGWQATAGAFTAVLLLGAVIVAVTAHLFYNVFPTTTSGRDPDLPLVNGTPDKSPPMGNNISGHIPGRAPQ